MTASRKIDKNPGEITKIFDDCRGIWELAGVIYKGALSYLQSQKKPCLISGISSFLEKEGIIPKKRYGEARYKQYEKRIKHLLRVDRRFRKIPKYKDMFELRT